MASSDAIAEMQYCALENQIKVRPGATLCLSQELQIPSGSYLVSIEELKKESRLRKGLVGHIAVSGELIYTTTKKGDKEKEEKREKGENEEKGEKKEKGEQVEKVKGEEEMEVELLKSSVDFREYPFVREVVIPDTIKDGASEIAVTINMKLTMVSTKSLQKARLRVRLLTKNSHTQIQVLSCNMKEKKRSGRIKEKNGLRKTITAFSAYEETSSTSSSLSDLPNLENSGTFSPSLSSSLSSSLCSSLGASYTSSLCSSPSPLLPRNDSSSSSSPSPSSSSSPLSPQVERDNTTPATEVDSKEKEKDKENVEKNNKEREKNNKEIEALGSHPPLTPSVSSSTLDSSYTENLVYYKEIELRKKNVHIEKIPIQQKGKYYVVIENIDKSPMSRHFSCHLTLCHQTSLLKESFMNEIKRKISDMFIVDAETADLTLEIAHTNSSFGTTDIQVSLYLKSATLQEAFSPLNPAAAAVSGETVWSVSAIEVEKKHPQRYVTSIKASGKYYIVAEKVDTIYGGMREISVEATLTVPPQKDGEEARVSKVASAVVGGVKEMPMKWKSNYFTAPANSVVEFNVASFALVGSIVYSLRLRKVPGLTAEDEKKRKIVLTILLTLGIFYFVYEAVRFMIFVQSIGITFPFLLFSVDITIGRICFVLSAIWFNNNKDSLRQRLHDMLDSSRRVIRKIKYFREISRGGKFDMLRIFKQMSSEGKVNKLKKWEKQKMQTEHE